MSMRSFSYLPDQDLIKEYRNDNLEAFNVLILRYKDQLYTSIYLLVKDKELAEDIFQEAFVRAIKFIKTDRYNDKGMFLAWMIRIAHNMYLDHLRKIKRLPGIRSVDNYTVANELNTSTDDADRRIDEEQRLEKIRQMIFLLPKDQQEIIILRHYADLSFREIATILNISINTALGRIRYALMNLRKIMKEKEITF
jgi:RNA polymerase sigma factor (sigma-70 family)